MLSQLSTKPTKATILLAKRALELTKKICKPLVGDTVPIIRIYTDAWYNMHKCEGMVDRCNMRHKQACDFGRETVVVEANNILVQRNYSVFSTSTSTISKEKYLIT
eukprot:GHVR01014993.1.p1 GENE.GHVR01014993.1~~GHVR01014993.1.p1  ORF type:complete len:106 (+),score=5.54 GHVR01014993.1:188-505(+)